MDNIWGKIIEKIKNHQRGDEELTEWLSENYSIKEKESKEEVVRKKRERILELSHTLEKVFRNTKLKPNTGDEYQPIRDELKILRKEVWDHIYPKSYLKGGDPQHPDLKVLEKFRKDH